MCDCGCDRELSVHKNRRVCRKLAAVLADFMDDNAAFGAGCGTCDQIVVHSSDPGRSSELDLSPQAIKLFVHSFPVLHSAPRSIRMTAEATAVRSRPATP